ncbi:hypothetical protein [Actinomadura oligospora]|uniref:hypothetical protein n=1 Tax=Actinomadura oligospora TaxID=111804 RepID=UPI000478CEAD|nr:hypothetical protein [Actinomadura oligospora]
MAQRKLPDLSATQLIASGAATMVAAYGASYLGVYGTILGAAFMSVVSTAASVVGKHYLDQGKEQIRERTHPGLADEDGRDPGEAARTVTGADATRAAGSPLTANRPGITRVADTRVGGAAARARAGSPAGWASAPGRRAGSDPDNTRVDDVPGRDPNATRIDLPTLGDPNATRFDGSVLDAARFGQSPAETVSDELVAETPAHGDGPVPKASWQAAMDDALHWAKQRWRLLTASAVVVFVVVIGGITLYESVTDRTFGGVNGTGGTIGNVIRGQNEGTAETPAHEPSQKPTDEPTTPGTSNPDGGTGVTNEPTNTPSGGPSEQPSQTPTVPETPTQEPSGTPTQEPSSQPSGGQGTGGGATGKPGVQAPVPGAN